MEHLVYRLFAESDIDALVRMWRESRGGWPPGCFGASEVSAESVCSEEDSSGKLFTVVALSGERIVGCCRTSPYGGEPEASYVDVINVVPDMHGTGIGKALLLDAVARSVEHGMKRIDLHTWPANMKAVPLYKRTGFYWVPETKVYMQNYMPFLLGRQEFTSFLGEENWYGCLSRTIEVAPDAMMTDSGRDVFLYRFTRADGEVLEAEFDRQGRCLSGMRYPGWEARLSVDDGSRYHTGRPVAVTLEGNGMSLETAEVAAGESLLLSDRKGSTVTVTPCSVRLPFTKEEPAEKLTVSSDGLELGLGFMALEEVALHGSWLRFLPVGANSVSLGVERVGDKSSAAVTYSLDGGEPMHMVFNIMGAVYQTLELALPPLEPGVHSLSVQIGRHGYPETVVLVAGTHTGEPVAVDTRHKALVVSGDTVLAVDRKGGYAHICTRGPGSSPAAAGGFMILAGPPSWNSDLTRQRFSLELAGDTVRGETAWPSKPGFVYGFAVRLDPAGYAQGRAWVRNGSKASGKAAFIVMNGFSQALEPKEYLLPVAEGVLRVKPVFNQIPDWDEDLTREVNGLAEPWFGAAGGGLSIMSSFQGYTRFEYDMPSTEEVTVAPGGEISSPPFRMLLSGCGWEGLLAKAEGLGWQVGERRRQAEFLQHDLKPVMGSGAAVSLTHPLGGEREAEIRIGRRRLACGTVKRGHTIQGTLRGRGPAEVTLSVAKRDTVVPVHILSRPRGVEAKETGKGLLTLHNGRLKARLDPSAFGMVYSLKLDGGELLRSSHPEPSEYGWEKPWFGGIHPRYMVANARPFPLEKHKPSVEPVNEHIRGLTAVGWNMRWTIDHRDFGSVSLLWKVRMLPGVPVMVTVLECAALYGRHIPGEFEIRGFMSPGSTGKEVLTCESFPALRQGGEHAGAWVPLGKWGRQSGGGRFVEAYPEGRGTLFADDYGSMGSNFSLCGKHSEDTQLSLTWLFGAGEGDEALSKVFRAHAHR
jgi:ribosomal protein S18 acetylase RimI-like enzyme